jgi:hypothetical protein
VTDDIRAEDRHNLPGFRHRAPQALCGIAQITPVAARVLRETDWSKETPTPPPNDRYLRLAAVHWVDANGSKPPK